MASSVCRIKSCSCLLSRNRTLQSFKITTLGNSIPFKQPYTSELPSPNVNRLNSCRVLCTEPSKEKGFIYVDKKLSKETIENSAWACRLANENGYLSWCRNSYLMTGVGVGMLYKGQTEVAELAGYSAMLLAAISVSWGTAVFIYNLLFLRQRVNMSTWFVLLQSLTAFFHAFLYVMILIVFASESDKYFEKQGRKKIPDDT